MQKFEINVPFYAQLLIPWLLSLCNQHKLGANSGLMLVLDQSLILQT